MSAAVSAKPAIVAGKCAKPLADAVVAVTTYGAGDASASYRTLTALVRSTGARLSGTVHRNVHLVVCTASALERETQRARKAAALGIPLLSPRFLESCCAEGRKVEYEPFLLEPPAVPAEELARRARKRKQGESPKSELIGEVDWGPEIELGCCCSCHDEGKLSCSWCTSHHAAACSSSADPRCQDKHPRLD